GMIVRGLRQLRRAGNAFANCVNATISGFELSVHDDTRPLVTNSRSVEIEARNEWATPSRNEQMATGNRLLRATTFDRRGHCRASMRYIDNFHTAPDDDAFPLELGQHDVYTFRVVSAERLRHFKDRHGASEAPKALRQLQTRRLGAAD